ncbi:hypothetical protein H2199_005089 [Coniosporium tulheliwenetii]|uniref:Uncharacterized protein n=1 Tax=Coniosporium tulheliwenetii TaxID=3383036 RepID=A0ACC2Z3T1_9PEZI|nr:hypothetical protein H2199_005089 [Cladosporium sp. JES 115]
MTEPSENDSQWLARQRDIISRRMAGVYDFHEKALAAELSRRDQEKEREKARLCEEITRLDQEKQLMSNDLLRLLEKSKASEAEVFKLEQEKRALSDHVAKVIIQASATEQLQRENERLREEIKTLKLQVVGTLHPTVDGTKERGSSAEPNDAVEPRSSSEATIPTQEATVPYRDYHELTVKYNQCSEQMEAYRHAHRVLTEKYRASKERVKQFDTWYRRSKEKSVRPERTPAGTPTAGSFVPISAGEVTLSDNDLTPRASLRSTVYSDLPQAATDREEQIAVDSRLDDRAPAGPRALRNNDEREASGNPSSSQTTQDDVEREAPQEDVVEKNATTDEDAPVVVSARPVKRKRPASKGGSGIHIREDAEQPGDTPSRPVRIKDEPPSSPIVLGEASRPLTRTETLDLDSPGTDSDTPRKRRMRELLRQSQHGSFRSGLLDKLRHERSNSLPVSTQSQLHRADVPQGVPPAVVAPRGLGRCDSDPTDMLDERAINELMHTDVPESRDSPSYTSYKRHDKGSKWIHLVSEDSDVREKAPSSDDTKTKSLAAKAESHQRLSALLEGQSSENGSVSFDRTQTTKNIKRNQSPLTATKPSSKSPASNRTRQGQFIVSKPAQNDTRVSPVESNRRDAERLRNRPLEQLNLSDFKINPRYNQGEAFLFVDAVRGRDARRCLPGCTRPECCGGVFRAMAEAGGGADLARGLWDSSQDEDDDERLLRYLMGDLYDRQTVAEMSAEEKQELLVQARTRLLADRHGKHRHAFERSKTPPGYWRTDMPTTQEIEEDRQKAKQYERERVEMMYAEALRGGGAWTFRDE